MLNLKFLALLGYLAVSAAYERSSNSYYAVWTFGEPQHTKGEYKHFVMFLPKSYKFDYGVKDDQTGDHKTHMEYMDGNSVKGSYELHQPDGSRRIVKYLADQHGFHVNVRNKGEYIHPRGGRSYQKFMMDT